MKNVHTFLKKMLLLVVIAAATHSALAQNMMPMPAHASNYSSSVRGFWFIAPCDFTITGLMVPTIAGTGLQYIHIMKCHDPFPIATSGSTNFTTLQYISGAPNGVLQNTNLQIRQGDTIGILGTNGTANSYTASGLHTTTIGNFTVPITRLGYQGDIDLGPAPNYWGTDVSAGGSISRVEVYYTLQKAYDNAAISALVSPQPVPLPGAHDIKVKIANRGANIINNVNIDWEINGLPQPTVSWFSPIDTVGGTGKSDTIITLTSAYSFNAGTQYNIKAWTSMPNSTADTSNTDDTIQVTISPPFPIVPSYSNGYAIYGIQDFDTIAIPNLPYQATSGNLTFANGNTATTSSPPNSPYGINGSWAWYQEAQSGGVTLTFDNITLPGYDTIFATFKLAAIAVSGTSGVDAGDYALVSVSTDGGNVWHDQVEIQGAGGSTSWPYSATGEVSKIFSTSGVTVVPAPANTLSNLGPSTITIKIPNSTGQARLRITLRSSASGERYCVDDVEIKVKSSTYNDASVASLISPSAMYCAGTYPVDVQIKNEGKNQISNVNINWSLNGILQTPFYWTGLLDTLGGSGQQTAIVNISSGMFFGSGSPTLVKVWTSDPNFIADTTNSNDTLNITLKSAMSGTYTIGAVNSDYNSFAAAINDITQQGLCGPVVFNVRTGTYTDQIGFITTIPGASKANSITFQSMAGHRDSVVINYTATGAADDYVVLFSNSDHITIKGMTLNALSSSYGTVINVVGSSSHNTVDSCVLNGTEFGIYSDDVTGTNNTFRYNLINNPSASYGIRYYGESTLLTDSIVFENNTIVNNGSYPMYIYNTRNSRISNNHISGTSTYGMRIYDNWDAMEITGNIIAKTSGTYGMYIYYLTGTAASMPLVANNVISGCNYGIRNYYGNYQRFYNNTIKGGSSAGVYVSYAAAYTNNEWKNNIIIGGTGEAFNPVNLTGTDNVFNYNVYYHATPSLVIDGYNNFDAWRAATGNDSNSIVYNPVFNSGSLQPDINIPDAWYLHGTGTQLPAVETDINGNARPVTLSQGAPDPGAYEFTPTSIPPLATAVPATPMAGTMQAFLYGGDTIAKINWASASSVPSTIIARLYRGVYPPNIIPGTHNSMNMYWDFDAPAGLYNYDISLYYRNALIGSNPSEQNMIGTKKSGSNPWVHYYSPQSFVDANNNVLTITGLSDFSLFTGTDNVNPLPVKFTSLSAQALNNHSHLSWSTISEKNVSHFIIEASVDGLTFKQTGHLNAVGNSSKIINYVYMHYNAKAEMNTNVIYYRVVSVDKDGSMEYSKTAVVNFAEAANTLQSAKVYPNPSAGLFKLSINSLSKAQAAMVEIIDIQGRTVRNYTYQLNEGINEFSVDLDPTIEKGLYVMKIMMGTESRILKLIKQ